MANLELDVIRGIIRKTLILGVILWAGSWWFAGSGFAAAVAVGVLVASANLLFVAWLSKVVIGAGRKGKKGVRAGWMVLSVVKMAALFGLVWYLIAHLQLDAIGFVIGFSSFLPAIAWQVISSLDVDTSDPSA